MRRLLQVAAPIGLSGAVLSTPAGADACDVSRDTLPANDGWAGSERDLTADVGWTPTLHTKIDSADTADREVARGAGAGRHT